MMTNLKILLAFVFGLATMYFMKPKDVKEVVKIEYVDRVVERVVSRQTTETKKPSGEVVTVTLENSKESELKRSQIFLSEKPKIDRYGLGLTSSKSVVAQARIGDLPLFLHAQTNLKNSEIGVFYKW